jgi:hypothetical protein
MFSTKRPGHNEEQKKNTGQDGGESSFFSVYTGRKNSGAGGFF